MAAEMALGSTPQPPVPVASVEPIADPVEVAATIGADLLLTPCHRQRAA